MAEAARATLEAATASAADAVAHEAAAKQEALDAAVALEVPLLAQSEAQAGWDAWSETFALRQETIELLQRELRLSPPPDASVGRSIAFDQLDGHTRPGCTRWWGAQLH